MLCGDTACGCAIQSSTLNVSGSGTPADPWVVEQAEFTDITAMQADIAALQSAMTAAQGDISDLETDVADLLADSTRFDSMAASTTAQAGAVGPTSGTTALVIVTATLGPFGRAGMLVVGGHAAYTKTDATDTFSVYARSDGVTLARAQDRTQLTSGWGYAGRAIAVAASDNPTVDVVLQRDSGTGSATTVAAVNGAGLWWVFIPN